MIPSTSTENANDELKIWIVVRIDLEMPPGKLVAQAGHAALNTYLQALRQRPTDAAAYLMGATPKIAIRAPTEGALLRAAHEADAADIPHALICDAGRTVFPEPTHTTVGIGPCRRSELPKFIVRLRLL